MKKISEYSLVGVREDLTEKIIITKSALESEYDSYVFKEISGVSSEQTWKWMLRLGRKYNDSLLIKRALSIRDTIIKEMAEY